MKKEFARRFYDIFPDTFLFVNRVWYHFNGVYWENDALMTIRRLISTALHDALINEHKYEHKCDMLYDTNYKNCIIAEMKKYYEYNDIKFNERHELFAFNNRVFDLSKGEWVQPTSDMYISMTTGYDYVEVADEEIEEMKRWVGTLFESEEKTKYVLHFLASCLLRDNWNKQTTFWIGRGRNGKSCLKDMMDVALGKCTGDFVTLIDNEPVSKKGIYIIFPYHFMPPDMYDTTDPTHKKQDVTIKDAIPGKRNIFINMLLKLYCNTGI
jgi:hypothetical protein